MTNLKIIVLATIASLISTFLFYNYLPLQFIDWTHHTTPKFGATITTINGTDTISGSRTTINNNFTNLNNGKIENATTSVASITTLSGLTTASALATVGTLTSGAIGAGFGTLNVGQGGTGSTTLSANEIFAGNGTSAFQSVGWGALNQVLTSQGGGTLPVWSNASVDSTANYVWTGLHYFNSGIRIGSTLNATGTSMFTNLNASSTVTINGLAYVWPATQTGNYFLKTDGSSNLSWATSTAGVMSTSTTFAAPTTNGTRTTKTVYCVAPKVVVSGGYSNNNSSSAGASGAIQIYSISENDPSASNAWTVGFMCTATNAQVCSGDNITVYAVCANP